MAISKSCSWLLHVSESPDRIGCSFVLSDRIGSTMLNLSCAAVEYTVHCCPLQLPAGFGCSGTIASSGFKSIVQAALQVQIVGNVGSCRQTTWAPHPRNAPRHILLMMALKQALQVSVHLADTFTEQSQLPLNYTSPKRP